jgi:hypothetical protein
VPSDGSVRAVIDTNVPLSGLMWHGKPHALIEQVRAGTLVPAPLRWGLGEVHRRYRYAER